MTMPVSIACMLVWGIASAFGATVKWTTYQDDQCTVLCPLGGTACETTADTSVTCNQNSEASWNNLVCHSDYITYDNFPNTGSNQGTYSACDTSVTCIQNLLHVGVCQYFPGPVPTWKKIDASTYTCTGSSTTVTQSCTALAPTAAPTQATNGAARIPIRLTLVYIMIGAVAALMI